VARIEFADASAIALVYFSPLAMGHAASKNLHQYEGLRVKLWWLFGQGRAVVASTRSRGTAPSMDKILTYDDHGTDIAINYTALVVTGVPIILQLGHLRPHRFTLATRLAWIPLAIGLFVFQVM
jgi:hypothetical protein